MTSVIVGPATSAVYWPRLKTVCDIASSNVDKITDPDETPVRLCNYVDVYKNDNIHGGMDFMAASATTAQIKRFALREDDVIITKDSETPDDIAVPTYVNKSASGIVCGYHLALLRPDRRRIDGKFLCWALRAGPVARDFSTRAQGITRFGLTVNAIGEVRVPLPDLAAQRHTALFLDRETGKIDMLITKQKSLLDGLDARREALAASVFQNAPRSSFTRIKFFCDILPGYAFPSERYEQKEDGIRLLRGINVAPGRIDWTEFVSMEAGSLAEFRRFQLACNDIVIGMDRPWIGSGLRVALIRSEDIPSLLVQRVARLRCYPEVLPAYAEICLRSRQFLAHVEPDMTGVSVPHISDRQIGDFKIPVPTIGEQRDIVAKVGAQLAKLASLKEQIWTLVEIMRERRTALITSAITGQIEIPSVPIEQAA